MTKKTLIHLLVVTAMALVAAPAFALDAADNPGTEYQQANQPEETPDQTDNAGTEYSDAAPYSADDNPGLTRAEARALGREYCADFKANFKENRSAFGKCVAAVAKSLRDENESARSACDAANLTRERVDGEKRSDFKACVLAAKRAERDAEQD